MSRSTCDFRDDDLVVNYHDAVVYGSDLKLFETPTAWLNDACIHFFFTWLNHRRSDDASAAIPATDQTTTISSTVFLDPAVVSFVMNQCTDQEDVDDFLSGYSNFDSVQRIFLPINDLLASAQWARPGGGSHWSLLQIIIIPEHQQGTTTLHGEASYHMWHFDSIRGQNIKTARVVALKFQQILDHAASKRQRSGTTFQPSNQVVVAECTTPQQINGYDCGVHMLVAAEALSELSMTEVSQERCEQVLRDRVSRQSCPKTRLRVATKIRELHHSS